MSRIDDFRQYANDCMQQAAHAPRPEDKTILLNMALAWVRLAKQSQDADAAETVVPGESGLPPPGRSAPQTGAPASR